MVACFGTWSRWLSPHGRWAEMASRRFQRATIMVKPMADGVQVILGGVGLSARDFAALADAAAQAITPWRCRVAGSRNARTPRRRRSRA